MCSLESIRIISKWLLFFVHFRVIDSSEDKDDQQQTVEAGYEEECQPGKSKEHSNSEEVDSRSENNGIFLLNNCYKSNEQNNVSLNFYPRYIYD